MCLCCDELSAAPFCRPRHQYLMCPDGGVCVCALNPQCWWPGQIGVFQGKRTGYGSLVQRAVWWCRRGGTKGPAITRLYQLPSDWQMRMAAGHAAWLGQEKLCGWGPAEHMPHPHIPPPRPQAVPAASCNTLHPPCKLHHVCADVYV